MAKIKAIWIKQYRVKKDGTTRPKSVTVAVNGKKKFKRVEYKDQVSGLYKDFNRKIYKPMS